MSRRARSRNSHPRRCALNSVEIAINGARRLSDADVAGHYALIVRAKDEFARGVDCQRHWLSLADTANVAETFASMGLGRGEDADTVIQRAQQALHDVHQRHATRNTWTLYADEIDALHWLVQLHHVQLGACSYSEFARAFDLTEQRMAQALAGNAPAGAIVCIGQIAQQPSATGAL
jgi:hypothetical protein